MDRLVLPRVRTMTTAVSSESNGFHLQLKNLDVALVPVKQFAARSSKDGQVGTYAHGGSNESRL